MNTKERLEMVHAIRTILSHITEDSVFCSEEFDLHAYVKVHHYPEEIIAKISPIDDKSLALQMSLFIGVMGHLYKTQRDILECDGVVNKFPCDF